MGAQVLSAVQRWSTFQTSPLLEVSLYEDGPKLTRNRTSFLEVSYIAASMQDD